MRTVQESAGKKRPKIMREDQATKHIPLDFVERILSKLPTKAVLRFSAVSKPWNAAIHTPRFGRLHRSTACDNDDGGDQLFIWPSSYSGIYSLGRFKGLEFDIVSYRQSPLEKMNPPPLCSCDGLFLIHDAARKICALWNPINGSKMYFAYPETTMNVSPDQATHGICYDPLEEDYKVVFVNRSSLLYTVFSCRNGSWTVPKQFPYKNINRDPGVSVRGVPYWVVNAPDRIEEMENRVRRGIYGLYRTYITDEIAYFDANECGFNKFHGPDEAMAADSILLTSLNGRLCLREDPNLIIEKDVWLLERDHSAWTKLAVFPCHWKADIVQSAVKDGGSNASFVTGPAPFSLYYMERNRVPIHAFYCYGYGHDDITSQGYAVLQGSLVVLPTAAQQESGVII